MLYFLIGDGVPLQSRYEELIKEIKSKNQGIESFIYDFSQNENEQFLERASQFSMFQSKELLIVKRFESLKGIDKFLKFIEKINLSQKEILFLYEEFFDEFGRKEDEKDKAAQDKKKKMFEEVAKIGKIFEARTENMKKSATFYIMDKLSITEKESEELLKILNCDFFSIKNECEKIQSFLNGEKYSLEKIMGIITLNSETTMRLEIEKLLLNRDSKRLIELLEEKNEYQQFIYILFEELLIYYKLVSLEKQNCLNFNIRYNDFKTVFEKYNKLFLNEKTGRAQHPYSIFLKLKLAKEFKQEFLMEKLKELTELDYQIKSGECEPQIGVSLFIFNFTR